jgi:heme oxygenase
MKRIIDTYHFHDLGALRDWLDQFKLTELESVYLESRTSQHIIDDASMQIEWIEETLSDGSKVNNARIVMQFN